MKTSLWILNATLSLVAAGCGLGSLAGTGNGDGTGMATSSVQVSVFVPAAPAAVAADACGITLTSAKLVFRRIKLNGHPADCSGSPSPTETATPAFDSGSDDGAGDDNGSGGHGSDDAAGDDNGGDDNGNDDSSGCEVETSVGPFLVDLTASDLNGVFQQAVLTAALPVGSYYRARFDLHKLEDGATSSDAALQEMASLGLSLRVEGTTEAGAAFQIDSDVNDVQEKSIALEVGDVTTGVEGITLAVDPSTWFGEAGACLDPVTSVDAIEDRIRASIDLREDDDHDGSSDTN